jgi:predicted HTH domain antitoxin
LPPAVDGARARAGGPPDRLTCGLRREPRLARQVQSADEAIDLARDLVEVSEHLDAPEGTVRIGGWVGQEHHAVPHPPIGRADMPTREITVHVPDSVLIAEKTDEAGFARELALLAAVKLFELGRLSSSRAAELAGMSHVAFLLNLGRFKVFPFQAELDDLDATGG